MAINTYSYPAKPRSKFFEYYPNHNTSNAGGSSSFGTSIQQTNPNDSETMIIQPLGTGNVVSKVENNPTEPVVLDVTYIDAVTKINAGTNITINPTSGIGEVTINSSGSLNFVQGNVNLPLTKYITYNALTSTLTETRGNGYTFNQAGTGNTLVSVLAQGVSNPLTQDIPVNFSLGYRMSALTTSGSGNAVGSLNFSNGVLTANMTNITGGGGSFNFVAGNQNLPLTKNLTWNSGTSTLTETRGYGYTFSNVGTGNAVTGVMPVGVSNPLTQDIPVSVTLGWYVNNVTENADSSSGFYFRSANAAPSITNSGMNSTLNLPYKQLQAGTGISLTNSGSSVIITNTGGGSGGGNVISNLPVGHTTIRMFRYEYFLPSALNITGYGNSLISNVSKSTITGITSIYNYFPSLTYQTTSVTPVPVTLQIIDDGGATFRILVVNCNSSSVSVPANTEIDVLIFGV